MGALQTHLYTHTQTIKTHDAHVCACMQVCIYAVLHVCMYAYMHVCMYACIHYITHVCLYVCVDRR